VSGCADLVGLVGLQQVFALAVLVREDRDSLGAELGRGAKGADGDLATRILRNTGASGGFDIRARFSTSVGNLARRSSWPDVK